ncbi:AraC family transcriptional regulator [Catenulispora yoronensis]|uniref:AraC family transcriptional regulator n=2 Tax=Catenulispora yoronensis TaxID=450799 RepID=A0ABP5FXV9_9ACTN
MTAPPQNFADRPEESYDLLSELLQSVRLSGDRIVGHAAPQSASVTFTDMGCLHMIDEGEVVLQVAGESRVEHLRSGDFVLLPRGDEHSLDVISGPAQWLCGTFSIGDPQASHLLGSLPPAIVLRGGDMADGGKADWFEGLEVARRMAVLEMQSPSQGSAVMIARILDVIFIQMVRAWASSADAEPNWLAGAFDPQIGVALSAIHRDPCHDWTVEELARACNLSRSSFAARFGARVGRPPATYLAHVRLHTATELLRDTQLSIAVVAKRVGYESEAAFSRAFKNRYGTPPAHWRREAYASTGGGTKPPPVGPAR